MANFLLVANWKSDVGYAWWLMENFWVQLSILAQRKRSESHLIFPKITSIPQAINTAAIHVHQLDYEDNSPAGLVRLAVFVASHRIRYVYLSDKSFLSIKHLLLRCLGVRRIIVHDHSPGQRTVPVGIKRLAKKALHALPLLTADAFIATTSYVQERHLRSVCIPPRKSYVAQNGIMPIGRNREYQNYCSAEFGIPNDATIIFTSGRADRYKQIDFVIECANVLINSWKISDLYFIYCGDGPDFNDLVALANSYQLKKKFIFAGNRPDVRLIVQACHIGIQASQGEVGYSLSILEYMSAGLATLVPDNPSVCASIKHNVSGLVYEENDIISACEAIRTLAQNTLHRENLGRTAMLEVERNYNLQQTNRELVAAVDRVIFAKSMG